MQAIILAGGFGTRLQEVVRNVPKPMAPIGKKPFLALLIDSLRFFGITKIVLSVHYKKELIEEHFKNNYKGISIIYAEEEMPLGTGGSIINSLNILKPKEPVVVLNGDTYAKVDIKRMYKQHIEQKAKLTIALRSVEDCSRYGQVVVEGNIITDFCHRGDNSEGYINAGVYVMNPDLFEEHTLNNSFSFESDFLYQDVPEIKPQAFFTEDYFIDIGIPEDYKRACEELPALIG